MCKENISGIVLCAVLVFLSGCAVQRKINALSADSVRAGVGIIDGYIGEAGCNADRKRVAEDTAGLCKGDVESVNTEIRDLSGNRIIMNAVKDEQSGEMVATDVLSEIVVEAAFRNVAERNGKVDVAFEITVPQRMQDEAWQVRFTPCFLIQGDTLYSDQVHITGAKYRAEQLRGYELYRKFLNSIIPDSCDFIASFCYRRLMEIFIDRKFKANPDWENDTVVRHEVVDYYTRRSRLALNNKRKMMREGMFKKYVKSPFMTGGVRLDSVITSPDGSLKYQYVQTIKAKKGLRKIDMVMSGEIYVQGKLLYDMPETPPLTFYVSSITAFADNKIRYIKKILERNLNINTAAYIDFKAGEYFLNDTLFDNAYEIGRIKDNIRRILSHDDFIADSLIITASCSPEGSYGSNVLLARNRAAAIKAYFNSYVISYRDSCRNSVWDINLSGKGDTPARERGMPLRYGKIFDIRTGYIPEAWERLEKLIVNDTNILHASSLLQCFEIADPDSREKALQRCPDYKYVRSTLYPYLRTVKFDFFLHRKGMIKDTVHTTQVDTAYMRGLHALQDRDYKVAVTLLRPYEDFNSAVAYVCMDYNQSALSVLERLSRSAKRDYMLAVVYSRLGDERRAVELYLHSCEQEPSMRFRGNLDPEISQLIKKYGINKE